MVEKLRNVVPFSAREAQPSTSFRKRDDRETLNDAYREVGEALLDGDLSVAKKQIERGLQIIGDPTNDLNVGDRLWWSGEFNEFQTMLSEMECGALPPKLG